MNTPFTIEDELQATRTAIARVQEVIDSEPTEPPRRSLLTNLKSLEKRQRNLEAELLVRDTGISTEALEGYEQVGSELLQRLLSAKEELSCVQHDMDRLTKRGLDVVQQLERIAQEFGLVDSISVVAAKPAGKPTGERPPK